MAYMTLDDFRTDLQGALGDRGFDNTKLDRWINFGYLDLAGSVEFEVLNKIATVPTVASTAYIAAPTNSMIIHLVRDTTTDDLLGWIPKAELFRRSQVTTGTPKHWTRHGSLIYLNPVPSGILSLDVFYKETPTRMTATSDVSVFPDGWDQGIFYLAVHHALLTLGEEQRSVAWLSRAVAFIQSRMTETDLHAELSGLGASLPENGLAALQQRLQSFQGARG